MQYNFVVSTNERAVRLWQSFGFEVVGTLPRAFDQPDGGACGCVRYVQMRSVRINAHGCCS